MKTVTVNIQIQMDIKGDDNLKEVQDNLEIINNHLYSNNLESQPQIFISGISNSDIIEEREEEN